MGHQAAQCTVGTVNWRSMYGAEAFLLQRPVFQSEVEAVLKSRKIDFEDLTKRARDWAAGNRGGAAVAAVNGGAHVAPPPAVAPPQPEAAGLPAGWATAKDAQGKIYYWHKETKAVQWERPTEAPGQPPPPTAAAAAPDTNGASAEPIDPSNVATN